MKIRIEAGGAIRAYHDLSSGFGGYCALPETATNIPAGDYEVEGAHGNCGYCSGYCIRKITPINVVRVVKLNKTYCPICGAEEITAGVCDKH